MIGGTIVLSRIDDKYFPKAQGDDRFAGNVKFGNVSKAAVKQGTDFCSGSKFINNPPACK